MRTRGTLAVEVTENKETTEDNDNICDRDKHRGHGGMETLAKNCDEETSALLMCACLVIVLNKKKKNSDRSVTCTAMLFFFKSLCLPQPYLRNPSLYARRFASTKVRCS